MKKIAIIDFCGTVVNFQTFDPFMEYVLYKEKPLLYKLICNKFVKCVLGKFGWILGKCSFRKPLYKLLIVSAAKGISEELLLFYGQEYYGLRIKNSFIPETLKIIERLKLQNYMTIILSGGSEYYINFFANEYNIDAVISTRLKMLHHKCTGRIARDCLGIEKVKMLEEYLTVNDIKVKEELCITDSITDMPLLSICSKNIIISHLKHQKWVTEDMEEIIWE